ncbi:hypothetical protein [Flavobacterium sp.]|uniref:hypothetical protein n=1 Tax=Flavobacterium sp. TaxID=239 RepID=UPI003752B199
MNVKEYKFEFFNQKYTQKLVIKLLLVFIVLFITSILSKNKDFIVVGGLLSVIIPISIYLFNRKKIKKVGSAKIFENYTEFNLDNVETIINYRDIESYLIQHFEGTVFHLKLKDGRKFNISSNNRYCETFQFTVFAQDFEKVLQVYKTENQTDLIRSNTFFDSKFIFPFLIIVTVGFIFMIPYLIYFEKKLPIIPLLISIGPFIALWIGYSSNKKKK